MERTPLRLEPNGKLYQDTVYVGRILNDDHAQFVVKTWSLHDELLEACEKSLRVLEHIREFGAAGRFGGGLANDTRTELQQIIAKAKGSKDGQGT